MVFIYIIRKVNSIFLNDKCCRIFYLKLIEKASYYAGRVLLDTVGSVVLKLRAFQNFSFNRKKKILRAVILPGGFHDI